MNFYIGNEEYKKKMQALSDYCSGMLKTHKDPMWKDNKDIEFVDNVLQKIVDNVDTYKKLDDNINYYYRYCNNNNIDPFDNFAEQIPVACMEKYYNNDERSNSSKSFVVKTFLINVITCENELTDLTKNDSALNRKIFDNNDINTHVENIKSELNGLIGELQQVADRVKVDNEKNAEYKERVSKEQIFSIQMSSVSNKNIIEKLLYVKSTDEADPMMNIFKFQQEDEVKAKYADVVKTLTNNINKNAILNIKIGTKNLIEGEKVSRKVVENGIELIEKLDRDELKNKNDINLSIESNKKEIEICNQNITDAQTKNIKLNDKKAKYINELSVMKTALNKLGADKALSNEELKAPDEYKLDVISFKEKYNTLNIGEGISDKIRIKKNEVGDVIRQLEKRAEKISKIALEKQKEQDIEQKNEEFVKVKKSFDYNIKKSEYKKNLYKVMVDLAYDQNIVFKSEKNKADEEKEKKEYNKLLDDISKDKELSKDLKNEVNVIKNEYSNLCELYSKTNAKRTKMFEVLKKNSEILGINSNYIEIIKKYPEVLPRESEIRSIMKDITNNMDEIRPEMQRINTINAAKHFWNTKEEMPKRYTNYANFYNAVEKEYKAYKDILESKDKCESKVINNRYEAANEYQNLVFGKDAVINGENEYKKINKKLNDFYKKTTEQIKTLKEVDKYLKTAYSHQSEIEDAEEDIKRILDQEKNAISVFEKQNEELHKQSDAISENIKEFRVVKKQFEVIGKLNFAIEENEIKKQEQEKIAKEKQEQERIAKEKQEQEKIAKEKQKLEYETEARAKIKQSHEKKVKETNEQLKLGKENLESMYEKGISKIVELQMDFKKVKKSLVYDTTEFKNMRDSIMNFKAEDYAKINGGFSDEQKEKLDKIFENIVNKCDKYQELKGNDVRRTDRGQSRYNFSANAKEAFVNITRGINEKKSELEGLKEKLRDLSREPETTIQEEIKGSNNSKKGMTMSKEHVKTKTSGLNKK